MCNRPFVVTDQKSYWKDLEGKVQDDTSELYN